MSRPAVEVAAVDEHSLPSAKAFLEHYPETSLFMLSNIRAFGPQLAIIASFLPLLVLIYTPFLPLQDSLLRGQAMSFERWFSWLRCQR